MSLHLSSSIGNVYPASSEVSGSAPTIDNPGYANWTGTPPPDSDYEICSIDTTSTIHIRQVTEYGYKRVYAVVGNTVLYSMNAVVTHPKVGFWAYESSNQVTIWYYWADENFTPSGTLAQQTGASNAYGALSLGTFPSDSVLVTDWDDTPSTDPSDPENRDPRGGEFADTMPFGNTGNIELTDIEEPYEQEYFKLITAYRLDAVDMQNLGDWLFLADFWQNLKNKFQGLSDPMQFVMGCHELGVNPSLFAVNNRAFALGGNELTPPGGGYMSVKALTGRFTKFDLGSINLKEVFGTSKDYTDVDIQLFLPYCGVKQLDPDIVVGTTLTLQVLIDAWSGDLLYLLHTSNENIGGKYYKQESIVYRWSGNCSTKIPIGKVDNTDAIIRLASSVVSIGAGIAVGGIGASVPMSGATVQQTALGVNIAASGVEGGLGVLSEGLKPTVQTSSGIGGTLGLMDLTTAYLIIKRGVPQYPENFRKQIGAPRYQTLPLSGLSGYTKFSTIHLENMGVAVEEEVQELERLLTSEGIIL